MYGIDVAIQHSVEHFKNITSIDFGNEQRIRDAQKLLFIRCENSSQNLGCLKTSTTSLNKLRKKHYLDRFHGFGISKMGKSL